MTKLPGRFGDHFESDIEHATDPPDRVGNEDIASSHPGSVESSQGEGGPLPGPRNAGILSVDLETADRRVASEGSATTDATLEEMSGWLSGAIESKLNTIQPSERANTIIALDGQQATTKVPIVRQANGVIVVA